MKDLTERIAAVIEYHCYDERTGCCDCGDWKYNPGERGEYYWERHVAAAIVAELGPLVSPSCGCTLRARFT